MHNLCIILDRLDLVVELAHFVCFRSGIEEPTNFSFAAQFVPAEVDFRLDFTSTTQPSLLGFASSLRPMPMFVRDLDS